MPATATATATPLADLYRDWLSAEIEARDVADGLVMLTAPYLDAHNDHLCLYVDRWADGTIILTDDGETIRNLDLGLSDGRLFVSNGGRAAAKILRGLGVELPVTPLWALTATATDADFSRKAHYLFLAMLAVGTIGRS